MTEQHYTTTKINWLEAPEGAMAFCGGDFWRVNFSTGRYCKYNQEARNWAQVDGMTKHDDYEPHPVLLTKFKMLAEWFENEQA